MPLAHGVTFETIEWPKGSGRTAVYTKPELEYVRGFREQAENSEITSQMLWTQVSHLHDLKVEFGVSLADPK